MTTDDPAATPDPHRYVATLERLLAISATSLKDALTHAAQLVAETLGAEKVDAFLHDPVRAALVAVGVSDTPLGHRERTIGMDVLPLAGGGRTVEVFTSGVPHQTGHADRDPQELPGFTDPITGLGIRSSLAAPFAVDDARRGVLEVVSPRPEAFGRDDLPFVEAVARWVGLVAQRAALAEQVTAAAAAQGRRAALQTVTDVALAHQHGGLDALLGHILARVRAALDGDTAVILLLDAGEQVLRVRAALGLEEEVAQGVRVPVGQGFAGRIAASREARLVPDVRQIEVVSPYLRERIRALVGVPLLVGDRLLGVMHVGRAAPRPFDEDDRRLLDLAAARVALAIDNAQLYSAEQAARAQAEAAVRVRDDFLAAATHDLRSPLTGLRARAQLVQRRLQRGTADPQWLEAQMDGVRAGAGRMLAVVDELADVARLQIGQALELDLEEVEVGALARAVAAESDAALGTGRVVVEGPAAPALVRGDRARLRRVLENVVGNALKYSPEETPVRVAVQAPIGPDGPVTIAVADRGVGIPAEELSRLFTSYYRASTARGRAGSGLGLWGARAIVAQHGGTIAIESAVGVGTTVTITLPAADGADSAGQTGQIERKEGDA